MARLSPARRLLKTFHPEGIPWAGTVFYNLVSGTGIFQRHYELVTKDLLSYCSEGSVLDIGTGPGWLLIKLHQECPELQLAGIDASPSMITKARNNIISAGFPDSIEVKEGYAENIPFADGSFNLVVSTGSIHHWKRPTASLNDIYRVLKHGGYALMYDLVTDTPASVLKKAASEFGRLKMLLLWLHAFEEPFYTCENFALLAQPTLFKEAQARFAGVMYCLVMKKE